jgi:GTP-binding protein YchF
MQIGIVGLPFSGKSTLFQTLTRSHLDDAAAHGRHTNAAMVKVPDERVNKLGEFFQPRKLVFTSIEFVDVVGLKKGDRDSTQFTGTFLASVKTNDALLHVVRTFDDPLYPHPEGSIDPARDIRILETEFLLADMAMVESRLDKLRRQVQKVHDDRSKAELKVLEQCSAWLEKEKPLRTLELDSNDKKIIRGFQFLTEKPLLVLLNLADDQIGEAEQKAAAIQKDFGDSKIMVDSFVGKIEMELAMMSDEDAELFMADYGIKESALKRIIQSAHRLLGLICFLTAGDDECRAWTIKEGMNAQEAAGAIHTDLMNRFIRAEVVHFDDFVSNGSMATCKEKGQWRLEGREYIVKDGDILTIRHG